MLYFQKSYRGKNAINILWLPAGASQKLSYPGLTWSLAIIDHDSVIFLLWKVPGLGTYKLCLVFFSPQAWHNHFPALETTTISLSAFFIQANWKSPRLCPLCHSLFSEYDDFQKQIKIKFPIQKTLLLKKKKGDTDPKVPFGLHRLTISFSTGYVNWVFSYFSDKAAKSASFKPSFYKRKWLLHSFGTSVRYGNSLLNTACGGEFWMFKQQDTLWYVITSHTHHGNSLSMPAAASGWISTTCQWQWDTDPLPVFGFQYLPLAWWSAMISSKGLQWGARRRANSQPWKSICRTLFCSGVLLLIIGCRSWWGWVVLTFTVSQSGKSWFFNHQIF